jgi:hypothetical protein
VYWQAPESEQASHTRWRDGAFLPTDIAYHRDHLGIVTKQLWRPNPDRRGRRGPRRDSSLVPGRPRRLRLFAGRLPHDQGAPGDVRVRELLIRPRDYSRPLVVGSLYLDVESAELVRFRSALHRRRISNAIWRTSASCWRTRSRWAASGCPTGRDRDPAAHQLAGFFRYAGSFEAVGDRRLRFQRGRPPAVLAGPEIGGLAHPQPSDSTWPTSPPQRYRIRGSPHRSTGHGGTSGRDHTSRLHSRIERASAHPAGCRFGE